MPLLTVSCKKLEALRVRLEDAATAKGVEAGGRSNHHPGTVMVNMCDAHRPDCVKRRKSMHSPGQHSSFSIFQALQESWEGGGL